MTSKVAVLGGSGNIGSAVTKEFSSRGKYEVIAVARKVDGIPKGLANVTPVAGDASKPEELIPKIEGIDVLVSALHFDVPAATILEIAKKSGAKRLISVGGAASLLVSEDGPRIFDTPDFPKEYIPVAKPGLAYLDDIRKETSYDWAFFSPPLEIGPGTKTGKYRLGKDVAIFDDKEESSISYDDYAVALVDEVENHKFSKTRFTAGY